MLNYQANPKELITPFFIPIKLFSSFRAQSYKIFSNFATGTSIK